MLGILHTVVIFFNYLRSGAIIVSRILERYAQEFLGKGVVTYSRYRRLYIYIMGDCLLIYYTTTFAAAGDNVLLLYSILNPLKNASVGADWFQQCVEDTDDSISSVLLLNLFFHSAKTISAT